MTPTLHTYFLADGWAGGDDKAVIEYRIPLDDYLSKVTVCSTCAERDCRWTWNVDYSDERWTVLVRPTQVKRKPDDKGWEVLIVWVEL